LFEKSLGEIVSRVTYEEVTSLDFDGGCFETTTGSQTVLSRTVVVASGTRPKRFKDLKIPEACRDKVHYEIVPLLETTGRTILIVGAGDAAFDYALNLTRSGTDNRVLVLNRGEVVKCLPLLQERAGRSSRISYHANIRITRISDECPEGVRLDCDGPGGKVVFDAHNVVFAIGREPCLGFLSRSLQEKIKILEENCSIHLVGDAKNDIFRQAAIGVGQGVMAAMRIHQRLADGF
jgi:thioredoxin reductase